MFKKNIAFFSMILFVISNCFSQRWEEVSARDYIPKGKIDFSPSIYKIFKINDAEIKSMLFTAPHETDVKAKNSNTTISVPSANGKIITFSIVKYDMMEKGLASQFPDYKTFYGVAVDNPYTTIRLDYTAFGFRAVIREMEEITFIDYASQKDLEHRIIYFKKDYPKLHDWTCSVKDFNDGHKSNDHNSIENRAGDCKNRTYRLANAATGEFTTFYGGTVALAQAGIVTIINRVNQVYESDLSVRLILVANNTSVIYTNAATDPYTNNDGVAMLAENQANLDAVILTANYDVGHVFSTGGGGVANLGVPCTEAQKAQGVTGLTAPTGDPFAIDYVAHEMGHQFGADHTFNSASSANGSCNPSNNNPSTSVEPGSGSTIMAYAGICSPVNVQNNSDAYFHAISIGEIFAEIATHTCDVETASGNTKPVITAAPDYVIPVSTPFVLNGVATDPNGNPLTYCWEQTDAATSTTTPTATSTTQTQFRSYIQSSNTRRYFPKQSFLLSNTNNTWEVLSTVTRSMKFRLTVRDLNGTFGCSTEDDIVVNTNATAGPFVVNVLNTAPSPLVEGQIFTVIWNVANTTAAPVSAANVDILLSYDGGNTFPTTLVAQTPNDGSQDVVIPSGLTTTARIMVKGYNNVFFDVNNANFAINTATPTFFMTINPTSALICNSQSTTITINSQSVSGYTTPFNLSATGVPAGATAVFTPSTITPGQSSSLVLNNFGSNVGAYTVVITGANAGVTRTQNFSLTLQNAPVVPTLTAPADMATNISNLPTLTWSAGTSFEYQLSKTNTFAILAASGTTTTNSVTLTTPLDGASTYYWQVRSTSTCGNSAWSSIRSFTTSVCFIYNASGLPLLMPVPVATATSTLSISDKGTVSDLDIVSLTGLHTWVDDLKMTLTSPANTSQIIWNQPCNDEDNYNINFDDSAASATYPCPPTDGLTYKPSNVLSIFSTQSIKGIWKLKVDDVIPNFDGGQLNSWGVKMCINNFCRLEVQNNATNGVGSLFEAVACASSGDTIRFSPAMNNTTLDLMTSTLAIGKNLTILTSAANNISIVSQSTTAPTIDVTGAFNVKIVGLKIIGSQFSTYSALRNKGTLVLDGVEVKKNPIGSPTALFQNLSGGTVTMLGNCKVMQL